MSFGFGFGFPRSDTVADGGVPGGGASLRLNFLSSQTLDPRVTFSRTSNATQFDSTGALVYAPHNLLPNSEQFDNAAWTKSNATVTANVAVAPDGTTTADLFTSTGADGYVGRNLSITGGLPYSGSIYLRADTPVSLRLYLVETAGGSNVQFTTCNVTTSWQRFSVSITTGSAVTALSIQVGGGSTFTTGEAVYASGAQLNVDGLQPYYNTTVKNLLGYTQEFDNATWTKAASFIQTNQIRNNTMQGAVAGTPGTLPTNWVTVALGVSRQIVGYGIENGVSYIDIRFFGTPSSSADIQVLFEPNNGIAATNLTTYTESVFVALVGGSLANISAVRLAVGTYSAAAAFLEYLTGASISGSITSTMQRFSASVTTNNASTAFAQPAVGLSATSGQAVDFTLRVGWPQLVQGAVAGDPVATYGTARAVMYPAPDGSVTGDKLVENTANTQHVVFRSTTIVANTPHAASGYFKAGERTRINFRLLNGSFNSGANITFDLSNGTVPFSGLVGTGSNLLFSITPAGNGWYRCFASCIVDATSTSAVWAAYLVISGNNDSYLGDGTSGVYIFGAQLSDSASLDPYVYNPVAAPTAAAYYGPRFDYDPATLAPRGLLIEEQRTNSIRNNTMQGASAPSTFPTNWIGVGAGVGTLTQTIVGVGTSGGIAYIDLRLNGTTSTTSYGIGFDAVTQVAASAGQTWTSSFYVARVGGSVTNLTQIINRIVDRDAGGGNIGSASVDFMPTLSTTLARSLLTRTLAGVGTAAVSNDLVFIFASGVAIDITLRIGLPQLELGAFATSVIPTTTAAATRTADVATMVGANFSNWYRQSEGTLYFDARTYITYTVSNQFPFLVQADDGTTSNRIYSAARILSGLADSTYVVTTGGVVQATNDTVENDALLPKAIAYKINDFAFAVGGELEATDTSGLVPVVNRLCLGNQSAASNLLNGYLRQITYFPRRLANSELQTVTL